jgi:O-antigen ligase
MVIGLYFTLISRYLKNKRVILYAAILPILYLLLLTAHPFLIHTGRVDLIRFTQLTNPFEADTVAGKGQRLYLWAIYFQNLIKEPIGVGMGNLSQTFSVRTGEPDYLAPHNNFLQIGLGYSWLGLILFIVTLIYMFISFFRKILDKYEIDFNKNIAAIKIGILVSWIAGAFFNNLFTGHLAKIFWLFMGIKTFESEDIDLSSQKIDTEGLKG